MSGLVIIGSGNVGYHLALRLHQAGQSIAQVYSRSEDSGAELRALIGCTSTTRLEEIVPDATLYLLAVPDDAIQTVAGALPFLRTAFVAHTSGGTPIEVLQPYFEHYGVLYPLQSFSRQQTPDFGTIPIIVNGSDDTTRDLLNSIAQSISPVHANMRDDQRMALHLTAVMVNNFTNHLFAIAEDICQQEEIPFSLLNPLIQETVRKITQHSPVEMQTGPAKRGDNNTIMRHFQLLERYPEFVPVYAVMTQSILRQQEAAKGSNA